MDHAAKWIDSRKPFLQQNDQQYRDYVQKWLWPHKYISLNPKPNLFPISMPALPMPERSRAIPRQPPPNKRRHLSSLMVTAGLQQYIVLDWMSWVPLKSKYWNRVPDVMAFGGGSFERESGHQGGAFMNRVSALLRKGQKANLHSFSHLRIQEKLTVCNLEEGPQ